MESLYPQMSDDIEHIVIDAVSTDKTQDIVRRFSKTKVISEPDSGIYDGMNKGARLASGDWLLFLQGDDWLPEGAIRAYRDAVAGTPGCDMVCGSAEAVDGSPNTANTVWNVFENKEKTLTVGNIALGEPMINARIIKRDAFHRLGGFSLEYMLASDRDFLLRAAKAGIFQIETDAMTYRYRWHEGSSTMNYGNSLSSRLLLENLQIAFRHWETSPRPLRRDLRSWHSKLAVQGAMNSLEGRGQGFVRFLRIGSQLDILWSFGFLKELLRCLPGFVLRGFKTRSAISLRK